MFEKKQNEFIPLHLGISYHAIWSKISNPHSNGVTDVIVPILPWICSCTNMDVWVYTTKQPTLKN